MSIADLLRQLKRRWARPSVPRLSGAAKYHRATLDAMLAEPVGHRSPREVFGEVSAAFWFSCFTNGYREDERLRNILPGFPPEDVQYRFTGAAGEDTMREAFAFYSLVKSLLDDHAAHPPDSILEFGCGWGRIIRFFLRDVEPDRLWGVDCMPEAIELCKRTNTHCRFDLVDPFPPSNLPSEAFDLIYSYSVFSHLSEKAHLAWLGEFQRVLKPGGFLIATTRPREFILTCAKVRAAKEVRDWAQGTVLAFQDTEAALATFDRGEFLHQPIGGGDVLDASFFGETCIPLQYVRERWTKLFEFVGFVDDRSVCIQNVIIVRKPA